MLDSVDGTNDGFLHATFLLLQLLVLSHGIDLFSWHRDMMLCSANSTSATIKHNSHQSVSFLLFLPGTRSFLIATFLAPSSGDIFLISLRLESLNGIPESLKTLGIFFRNVYNQENSEDFFFSFSFDGRGFNRWFFVCLCHFM